MMGAWRDLAGTQSPVTFDRPARRPPRALGTLRALETSRRRRGFSLLDVLVGLALLALVFLAGVRLVLALGEAGEGAIRRGAERRQVAIARQALADDFASMSVCSQSGAAVTIASLNQLTNAASDESVAFYTDGGNGQIGLVAWRISSGLLERSETAAVPVASCASLAVSSVWKPYLSGIRAVSGQRMVSAIARRDGSESPYTGSCTGTAASACDFAALRLRFSAEPDPGAGPVAFDTIYPVAGGDS